MTEQLTGVEEPNFPYRRIPNNIGRYGPLQEVRLTLALQCGLDLVTDFQKREHKNKG